MDIALDPFPYNGTTTSCEALAMGVPLVVLEGAAHVARVGVALARQYGLDDWIAKTQDEYREIAITHAANPAALAELRSQMRARLAASDLGNPDQFVRHLEAAYREMMQRRE
jgi:predicted O-linked N-acetylglucosamine transferase (SPINDLY family)